MRYERNEHLCDINIGLDALVEICMLLFIRRETTMLSIQIQAIIELSLFTVLKFPFCRIAKKLRAKHLTCATNWHIKRTRITREFAGIVFKHPDECAKNVNFWM